MSRELYLAVKVIKYEEGYRAKPYYDSLGYPTIGYGELLSTVKFEALPDIVWSEYDADTALKAKLQVAIKEITTNKTTKPVWASLEDDDDRKAIVLSMWYQLGINGLAGFTDTLKAITSKDYVKAGSEMLNSDVARRVAQKRWKRQSSAMENGDVTTTYRF